ncbi:MAG: HisS family protein, partial [Candidatus Bathyarchaeia archaeon]
KEAGVTDKCLKTLQRMIDLKGGNTASVLDEMEKLVEDYENASKAAKNLREILELVGKSEKKLDIIVDAGFARGLEYYTGMIFEVYVPELDIALAGGGRYDKLVELFGGEPTPAVGVAHGIDRIMLAMQEQKTSLPAEGEKRVMVIPVNEKLNNEALRISEMLRNEGIAVEMEVMRRRVTKALEDADRRGISHVVIVGERELSEGAVVLRDMQKKEQSKVKIEELAQKIKSGGI